MGEKIKDLQSINIGKSSFMIELNEGYTAEQGRVIHIQNNKFRYLLKEKDFIRLASLVMRAWSEFKYIKENKIKLKKEDSFGIRKKISNETKEKVSIISKQFEDNGIRYRVLDIQEEMITFIIHPEDIIRFIDIASTNRWKKEIHPYGSDKGYSFLYQMNPFLLYSISDLYVEIYCQLPCASLTPKKWIPLDLSIQKRIWEKDDILNSYKMCDIKCQLIYHLCWAVFKNQGFSVYEKSIINENIEVFDDKDMFDMLNSVFFKYTEILIERLKNQQYDSAILEYYSYMEY